METKYLKDTLFDLCHRYDQYEDIIEDLRSLNSMGELTDEEYNIILDNYDEWVNEFEKEHNVY